MSIMKSLNAFLFPPELENQEVIVSKRYKDEEGHPISWEIRPITSAENDSLLKKHVKRDTKKGTESFDRLAYQNDLVTSAVVYPDLKNAELQKAWGVLGATQLLGKMLLVGEFTQLAEEVKSISGLNDEEDLVEQAKN